MGGGAVVDGGHQLEVVFHFKNKKNGQKGVFKTSRLTWLSGAFILFSSKGWESRSTKKESDCHLARTNANKGVEVNLSPVTSLKGRG